MSEIWLDCYLCGKALFIDDVKLSGTKLYHPECQPYVLEPHKTTLTPYQLDQFRLDPAGFCKQYLKDRKSKGKMDYFVTFTTRPDLTDDEITEWKQYLKTIVQWESVLSYRLCFEHQTSNIHAHCRLITSRPLNTNKFKKDKTRNPKYCFTKHEKNFGNVDIKPIRVDNGIEKYMAKEKDNTVYITTDW